MDMPGAFYASTNSAQDHASWARAHHDRLFARATNQALPPQTRPSTTDSVAGIYYENANAKRVNTDIVLFDALKQKYPNLTVIDFYRYNIDILAYLNSAAAASVSGSAVQLEEADTTASASWLRAAASEIWPGNMNRTVYIHPSRRLDGDNGVLALEPVYGRFLVTYHAHEFLLLLAEVRDGTFPNGPVQQYIVTSDPGPANEMLRAAGQWNNALHEEIWVFDGGFWQKDRALYAAIQKSHWEDIILDQAIKEELLDTVLTFYDSRAVYQKHRIPWKRGLIFYGPPGNGKTISIKATMKTLLDRKDSIPTLYVKSLRAFGGPEHGVTEIFKRARQDAPCCLVFEDLDSLVSDSVRSFFLNAVDGLSENEGILMIGSTNHLERLDPGIAKRPSRFDRKYFFPNPSFEERTRYCHFWQKKLQDSDDIDFPDKLCPAIARLTDKFSFAYMQEAFVSTLLKIATEGLHGGEEQQSNTKLSRRDAWDMVDVEEALDGDKGLEKYVLYKQIKIQIKSLREEIAKDST